MFDAEGMDLVFDNNLVESNLRSLNSPPSNDIVSVDLKFTNDFANGLSFAEFSKNPKAQRNMELTVREEVGKALDIGMEEIVVMKFEQGSIKINTQIPTSGLKKHAGQHPQNIVNTTKQKVASHMEIKYPTTFVKVETSFKTVKNTIQLAPGDFDSKGDYLFPSASGDRQKRGGMSYFQPNNSWQRYGLRVLGVFEDDKWIDMDETKGGWAVAFHGSSSGMNGYQGIFNTSTTHGDKKATNKSTPIPNPAIYFYMDVEKCHKTKSTLGGKNYEVAFQCRIHPDHIWEVGSDTMIAVDSPTWIRPYGVVVKKV